MNGQVMKTGYDAQSKSVQTLRMDTGEAETRLQQQVEKHG
jgi:hypothetical protein